MEKQPHSNNIDTRNVLNKSESDSLKKTDSDSLRAKDSNIFHKKQTSSDTKAELPSTAKKQLKPPKLEDKPFEEFICKHLIPGLKTCIEDKGTSVLDIKLIKGKRPVVGGTCWMVFCEMSEQRKFWLCFKNDVITSDKTILLAESNSDPSIVESFLIDEKKTTLPLLISRVLQRLNGQKWFGKN